MTKVDTRSNVCLGNGLSCSRKDLLFRPSGTNRGSKGVQTVQCVTGIRRCIPIRYCGPEHDRGVARPTVSLKESPVSTRVTILTLGGGKAEVITICIVGGI